MSMNDSRFADSHRKHLYKKSKGSSSKETFREEFKLRLKTKRDFVLWKRRQSSAPFDQIESLPPFSCEETERDILLRLMEEVEQEMINEDPAGWPDCNEITLEEMAEDLLREEVVCPLCEKRRLTVCGGRASCQCGLDLPVNSDMSNIRRLLMAEIEQHQTVCVRVAQFFQVWCEDAARDGLLLHCKECDYHKQVLL